MKVRILNTIGFLCFVLVVQATTAHSGFQDFIEKAMESLGIRQGLTDEDIIKGLKEALQIGTDNAVRLVSKKNGYFKNPKIQIPLPENVQKVENLLRTTGFGKQVDAFELSMNRAAERAAAGATPIFWEAIKQMTFTDARKILNGRDDEATLYFKEKTSAQLHNLFEPIVSQAMSEVGVTKAYKAVNKRIQALPFTESLRLDLDEYVTDKALDGLFLMLAEEEKKIRQDPAARVTELLRKVFGTG